MKRAPHVLLLGSVLGQPMGGVRRHNQELLPRLARLLAEGGGSLSVAEGLRPIAFELPISIERIAMPIPASPSGLRALAEAYAVRALVRASARPGKRPGARAGSPRFDLVHSAHLPAPPRLPLPFVLLVHDLKRLDGGQPAARALARTALVAAVRAAARVAAVSEHLRGRLIADAGAPPARVRVVPNGCDHLPVLPRRAAAGAPILCVAHLEPRKNQELLLRALAFDPGLPSLVLAGASKGREQSRLQELARELGVADRVSFAGLLDDLELARMYAQCACVVLPSRIEGFGIPVLEAQRAGAPVAVSRAGALREVAGLEAPSFAVDDVEGCASAARAAIGTGKAQLERARKRAGDWTWERAARELVGLWSEALG